MSTEGCEHSWGDPEVVEVRMGIVHSPLCKHCGAVKLEVGGQAAERRRQAWLDQEAAGPRVAIVVPIVGLSPPWGVVRAIRAFREEQGRLAL